MREILPELSAEGLELKSRAAEGQPGPVGALQALGQIRGFDWHPSSIRRLGAAFPGSSAVGAEESVAISNGVPGGAAALA